jgi:hypothetical protein
MSAAYLLVFSGSSAVDRKQISSLLDAMDGVEDWFYSIPNCIFIVGDFSATTISEIFLQKFGQHRHFITRISDDDRAGWIPKDHWLQLPKG